MPDPGCLDVPDLFDELLVIVLVAFAVVAVFMWGPAVVAFAAEIVLVVVLTAVAGLASLFKLFFRRPWRVMALRSWDEIWVWHQAGLRDARQLVREIRRGLEAGLTPSSIAPDRLDPASPLKLGTTAWTSRPVFQWGARVVIVIGIATVVVLFLASRSG